MLEVGDNCPRCGRLLTNENICGDLCIECQMEKDHIKRLHAGYKKPINLGYFKKDDKPPEGEMTFGGI